MRLLAFSPPLAPARPGGAVPSPPGRPVGRDRSRRRPGRLCTSRQAPGVRIATEPGSLDVSLDWGDVDRAGRYWVRWRSVDSGEDRAPRGVPVSKPFQGIFSGPDGLPASVSGDFLIAWESYPEVVTLELATFKP